MTPDVASDPFHDTVNVRVVTDVGAVALAVGTVLSTRFVQVFVGSGGLRSNTMSAWLLRTVPSATCFGFTLKYTTPWPWVPSALGGRKPRDGSSGSVPVTMSSARRSHWTWPCASTEACMSSCRPVPLPRSRTSLTEVASDAGVQRVVPNWIAPKLSVLTSYWAGSSWSVIRTSWAGAVAVLAFSKYTANVCTPSVPIACVAPPPAGPASSFGSSDETEVWVADVPPKHFAPASATFLTVPMPSRMPLIKLPPGNSDTTHDTPPRADQNMSDSDVAANGGALFATFRAISTPADIAVPRQGPPGMKPITRSRAASVHPPDPNVSAAGVVATMQFDESALRL